MDRHPSDSSLPDCVRQARDGNAASWKRIEHAIRQTVLPRLQLPPHLDPDELLADTLSEVWRAIDTLRDDAKLLSFAATIARRLASRMKKQTDRHRSLQREPTAPQREPGAQNVEGEEFLHSLTHSLREADRQLFRLLYVVGATSEEVQSSLGISGSLLHQRKHRLRRKLRDVTGEPEGEEAAGDP
ncbi:MAG: sigma-70 family RNA polymerase sigma factor [Planctomycetota bacterium]|nr:sigma-70 family RNA polymerase sigma factor [Planctomycetota bacterium]